MEDRQCKICLQWKPLFEFELWGNSTRRHFTCRDCMGVNAPVQPSEFAEKFNARPVKTCCVDDCDEPCKQGYAKCHRHMLEQWSEVESKLRPRGDKETCVEIGCSEPRTIAKNGRVYQRCETHQKEYNAAKNNRASDKKKITEAQKHAGFDRDASKASAKANTFKVCIIDHNKKTMTFVEGKVTRQCSVAGLEGLAGGFEIVLHGNTSKGYINIERGTRPEGASSDV